MRRTLSDTQRKEALTRHAIRILVRRLVAKRQRLLSRIAGKDWDMKATLCESVQLAAVDEALTRVGYFDRQVALREPRSSSSY